MVLFDAEDFHEESLKPSIQSGGPRSIESIEDMNFNPSSSMAFCGAGAVRLSTITKEERTITMIRRAKNGRFFI